MPRHRLQHRPGARPNLFGGRHGKRNRLARADQQHTQLMAGDDRGVYGDYPLTVEWGTT